MTSTTEHALTVVQRGQGGVRLQLGDYQINLTDEETRQVAEWLASGASLGRRAMAWPDSPLGTVSR